MSQTRAERNKQRKKLRRQRRKKCGGSFPWRLEVLVDGSWTVQRKFERWGQVMLYLNSVEAHRKAGEKILAGRIIKSDTNTAVAEVLPTPPGAEEKTAIPVLEDGGKTAIPPVDNKVTA